MKKYFNYFPKYFYFYNTIGEISWVYVCNCYV